MPAASQDNLALERESSIEMPEDKQIKNGKLETGENEFMPHQQNPKETKKAQTPKAKNTKMHEKQYAMLDVYLYIRDRCHKNKTKKITKLKRNFNSPVSICYI